LKKVTSVEEYIELHANFSELLEELRVIVLTTELKESIKWSSPVYSLNGKNVLGLGAFKHHAGIWFFQGVFLKDEHNKLVNAQEEKTKGLRQWRFEKNELTDGELIKAYILEAIENQKLGKEIKPDRNKTFKIPELIENKMNTNEEFKNYFNALSLSKQREYSEYIAEAKRETTKITRLEKIIPLIEAGKGLHDKYKNC
jgi:uncharacterized protein YdeI (YjbR/CyaY-like superfamily)